MLRRDWGLLRIEHGDKHGKMKGESPVASALAFFTMNWCRWQMIAYSLYLNYGRVA